MAAIPLQTQGLIGWFANNTVTANLLMVFLMVGGWIVAGSLNTETFPQVDANQITVSVPYPGATPQEVEDAISRRLEEAVTGIEGVERIRSTSNTGSGTVTLELKDFVDSNEVKEDVQSAVDQIADFPPTEAEEASIAIADTTPSVLQLAIYGDLGERSLRREAERIESALLNLDALSLVSLDGVRAYEVSIEVSEDQLRAYGLSLQQVANAIRSSSVNLSGGTLRTQGGEILLRTDRERRSGDEFASVIISSDSNGRTLYLDDIATIIDGFEDGELINLYQGKPAVFVNIGASDDQDAFDVSRAVSSFLETYAPSSDVSIAVVTDNTTLIGDRLNLLVRNSVLGLMLVFVLLALTLDLRLAFWTSLGIPVSFLGAFWIIGQFTTINMMTLFGLIIVLGIVVDDAVVVGENIYDAQQKGADMNAAITGARGVMAPVMIGVLTSMAAFAPLLFSTGTLGQVLLPVPVVVISVLAISLVEAFLILPAHLSHGGEWSVGIMRRLKTYCQSLLFSFRDRLVIPTIKSAMTFRYIFLAACVGAMIILAGLLREGLIRFVFFPQIEADTVTVSLQMAPGTPFEMTEAAMLDVSDAAIAAIGGEDSPDFKSLSLTIGSQSSSGFDPEGGGTSLGSDIGRATLTLAPAHLRTRSSNQIERAWRRAIGPIPGARSITFTSSLVAGGADISLNLSHQDSVQLEQAVSELALQLANLEGVTDVESSLDSGIRQIEFSLSRAGAAAGLTERDIARQVRQGFFGEEVQRIQRGREEVRVFVRLAKEERGSMAALDNFRIRLADGTEAPLYSVSTLHETLSPTSITRIDGQRRLSIEANVNEAVTTPNAVSAIVRNDILPGFVERMPGLNFSFEGQARDQQEDLTSLANNMLISLGLIYMLLASILRSYTQPFVIMSVIPFAGGCAILGHLIMGYDVSFLSLFGIVALSGVIINDSVVLIDYYNKLRRDEAQAVADAAIAAVTRRFRPILLTTLTTFLGLMPMILETSLQAQFLIPMAISLGFGILFAGFLILALVPCLLLIGSDMRLSFAQLLPAPTTTEAKP